MAENLWALFCMVLPALASAVAAGVLTIIAWVAVANQRPFCLPGSLIPLTVGVLYDGAVVINVFAHQKFFPMAVYGGSLVPYFYKWQVASFVLILIAGVLLFRERANPSRAAKWGLIVQSVVHGSAMLLFISWKL
jgi:multidrug transporter EmrE-like cation transporter